MNGIGKFFFKRKCKKLIIYFDYFNILKINLLSGKIIITVYRLYQKNRNKQNLHIIAHTTKSFLVANFICEDDEKSLDLLLSLYKYKIDKYKKEVLLPNFNKKYIKIEIDKKTIFTIICNLESTYINNIKLTSKDINEIFNIKYEDLFSITSDTDIVLDSYLGFINMNYEQFCINVKKILYRKINKLIYFR